MASPEPMGMALVGASGHAARVAAPTIDGSAGARLVGVLGSSVESGQRLAEQYPDATAYAEWDDLAADPAVEAVWVAGPNHLHTDFAERCLEAGKHVLVEKPISTRSADARRLADLADTKGLTIGVDFQHRFRSGHLWMHDAIRSGAVGKPHMLRIHRFWQYPYFPDMPDDISKSWRASVTDSGGWALNDIGSHLVDMALWLLGQDATLAFARTDNFRFESVDAEDTAVLVIDAADGATVIIETSNAMSSFPGTIEVHGSEGWIRADGTFDDEGSALTHTGERMTFESSWRGVYVAGLDDFVGRIAGAPAMGATGREAITTTEIIERAAAQHRGR